MLIQGADPAKNAEICIALTRAHHQRAIGWLETTLDACANGERLRLLPMVSAGFLCLVTHPRVFVEPTPLETAQSFMSGNATSDGWIAAAVLSRDECLATFDRDFVNQLPSRQLVLLDG